MNHLVAFDHGDQVEDRYLRRRTRKRLEPPRHYVPSSEAFAQAVKLGLGWGLIPYLQIPAGTDELIELDPSSTVDVPLFWQQWRLRSEPLDRVAAAVYACATRALH